jgi:hypothetical protein
VGPPTLHRKQGKTPEPELCPKQLAERWFDCILLVLVPISSRFVSNEAMLLWLVKFFASTGNTNMPRSKWNIADGGETVRGNPTPSSTAPLPAQAHD